MTLSARDKILLAIIAMAAVLGGAWWFVIKPASAELSDTRGELEQVVSETNSLRDTLARLERSAKGEGKRAAERLRLAKAIPDTVQAPAVIVQLQRLADRANVELTSIRTNAYSDYGSVRATEFEIRVSGRFFDIDDFLYRLHRQVRVNGKDRPVVGGRLFATVSVDLTLDQSTSGGAAGSRLAATDEVVGTVRVMAFSRVPAGAAGATTPVASTPGATPATPAPSGSTSGSGAPQATATPGSGGAQ